jgi:hypothetical protein
VDELERFLQQPANLKSQLERMDEVERAAVAEAAREPDGRLQPGRFRAKYGRVPGRDSASRLGLFFLGPRAEIPTDLRRRLLALTPKPPSASLPSSPDLPAPGPDSGELEVRMTEQAAAADLAAMLRLCEAGKLRCSDKTRRPTAATVQLVAESLADGEFYVGCCCRQAASRNWRAPACSSPAAAARPWRRRRTRPFATCGGVGSSTRCLTSSTGWTRSKARPAAVR